MYHFSCIRNNYRKLLHVLISKQHRNIFASSCTLDLTSFKSNENKNLNYRNNYYLLKVPAEINFLSLTKRNYSKKRKSSNKKIESDEESDSEEEDYIESLETDELGDNVITKAVPSMRIDTIIKAALSISKKKVEKEFYAFNLRLNGEKVLKKAMIVSVGDEIDLVKDVSPDNDRFLIVDRIIIMSVGNITGNLNYPLKLQIFKNLTIENYSEPWRKSGKDELEH